MIGEKISATKSYFDYRKTCKEMEFEPVGATIFWRIAWGFIQFMMEKVFDGNKVRMPENMGSIVILGKKIDPKTYTDDEGNEKTYGVVIDWGNTKKLCMERAKELGITVQEYYDITPIPKRPTVYHTNEHSNFLTYNITWDKENIMIKNHTYYMVRFCRRNKRTVSAKVFSGAEYEERQNCIVNNL